MFMKINILLILQKKLIQNSFFSYPKNHQINNCLIKTLFCYIKIAKLIDYHNIKSNFNLYSYFFITKNTPCHLNRKKRTLHRF